MNISINKAHYPVTVLGPGTRIGIWMQGCRIACKGCISQDTWAHDQAIMKQREMTIARLISWCKKVAVSGMDGITISGGEPFDQPKALSSLLDALLYWRSQSALDFDILCYSGYPFNTLKTKHPRILDKLDALIPEPFVEAKPITHIWRGSANQPLIPLSPRGEKRYGDVLKMEVGAVPKRIQTMLDGERIWYVGIPDRHDMEVLEASCQERGITFKQVSWRQ